MDKLPWIIGFALILAIPTKIAAKELGAKSTNWVSCFLANLLYILTWNSIEYIFKQFNLQYSPFIMFVISILLSGLIIALVLKASYLQAIGIALFSVGFIFYLAFLGFIIAGLIAWIMTFFNHPDIANDLWKFLATTTEAK